MKRILIILSLGMFASCVQEEIPQSELTDEQVLVINGELIPNQDIRFKVTNSIFAYYSRIGLFNLIDANVNLTKNGVAIPLTIDTAAGEFIANDQPGRGDIFKLSVEYPRFPTAVVETIIPQPPVFNGRGIQPEAGNDINGNLSERVFVQWADPANEKNYYRVRFYYYDELLGTYNLFTFNPAADAVLGSRQAYKLDDNSYVFNDELFDGSKAEIGVIPEYGLVLGNTDIKYMVQLEALSEDLYKYIRSKNLYNESLLNDAPNINLPPVSIHSNIQDGLGIFAGSVMAADTIR